MKPSVPLFFAISVCVALIGVGFGIRQAITSGVSGNAVGTQCKHLATGAKKQCWEDAVLFRLKTSGISESLQMLATFYEEDPEFAQPCHDIAHTIGRNAYLLFSKGKKIHVNEHTAYCSFGFYHGFMETLLAKKDNLSRAQDFCRMVDEQLGKNMSRARLACYHGVGHGVIDTHTPTARGNERAVVMPAVALCRTFAQTEEQLKLCGTGIFDALAIAYYNHQNGFVMRESDPLWLCREMTEPFTEACYRDLMDAILWVGDYDLAKAAPYIRFVSQVHAKESMKALADASVRFIMHKKSPAVYLPVCRGLAGDLHIPCIEGLASGLMQFGKPDVEYKEALVFCRIPDLIEEERRACVQSVINYGKGRYTKEVFQVMCRTLESRYQSLCQ